LEIFIYKTLVLHRPDDFIDFTLNCPLLSSRCILNMKRLLIWKNDPFKISRKFRKRLGSLSIVSSNSNDKEEVLEHQSYSGKRTEFQGKDTGTKWWL